MDRMSRQKVCHLLIIHIPKISSHTLFHKMAPGDRSFPTYVLSTEADTETEIISHSRDDKRQATKTQATCRSLA